MTQITRVIAVLGYPADHEDQLQRSRDIVEAINNGTSGVSTVASAASIVLAQAAQTAVGNHVAGAAADRDTKFAAMKLDSQHIMGEIQLLADADPSNAATIILSNGFYIKVQGSINKQDFVVRNGSVTETAELIAKGGGSRSAHDWGWRVKSPEDKPWNHYTPTISAHMAATGLTRGTIIEFRHRTITTDGPTDFIVLELLIQ
jgi:hypothetical protein